MRRTTKLVVAAALAASIGVTGCGTEEPKADTTAAASPTGDSSSTSSPSPTPSTGSTLSRLHPGRLELVRADELATSGGCRAKPERGLVCSPDGRSYRFDPDQAQDIGVVSTRATPTQPGAPDDWSVQLSLGPFGTRALARLTRAAAATHESALLMVPGTRRVLVAAQVQAAIRDGNIQISGTFDEARATRIVKLITATAG